MKALVNFYAAVNESSVNDVINFITQQVHIGTQNPDNPLEEVIIQLSSSGGSSDHGLLAFNYLKQLNIKKTIIGMGNVDSAAVMIFSAGDNRFAMPSCRFTLHEALTTITGTFNGVKLHEIANLNERITEDYSRVIHEITNKNLRTVRSKVKQGSVLSSEEAKKFGLVTDVIIEPYIKSIEGLNILIVNNQQPKPPQLAEQNHSVQS